MTVHLGKRDTGEILYIPFASYNDSGDSEALSGLAVSDIEVFKNGSATPRATDSGYSLISDTGQYGDRVGLYRFSIALFNTSDDTGFFDSNSQYHVAVDAVTIDGKTVRFFPAMFETGKTNEVLSTEIARVDTGLSETIDRTYAKVDTGISAEITAIDATTAVSNLSNKTDTGVPASVWASATRTLTAWAFDTGVQQAIARLDTGLSETIDLTLVKLDTGVGGGDIVSINGDTGAASRLGKWAGTKVTDSGTFDTGVGNLGATITNADVNITSFLGDTGSAAALRDFANEADTGRIQAEATATLDTGKVQQAVWGYVQDYADTGFLDRFRKWGRDKLTDSGTFDTGTGATGGGAATADTGAIATAVWAYSTRSTNVANDTGAVVDITRRIDYLDTGVNETIDLTLVKLDTGVTGGTVNLDTGQMNQAVWGADATRTLTAWAFDTGVQQRLNRLDTGLKADIVANNTLLGQVDTGMRDAIAQTYAKVDTGISAEITAINVTTAVTGLSAKLDTGVSAEISAIDTTTAVTGISSKLDTGVSAEIAAVTTAVTGKLDTGTSAEITAVGTAVSQSDTGIRQIVDKLTFDTGGNELHADIRKVNNVQIAGTGDTGLNDAWGPA